MRKFILGCVVLAASSAVPVFAQSGICDVQPISYIAGSSSGADAAAIQAGVDALRAKLGANNGDGSSYLTGFRELDWDDVPDDAAAPSLVTTNTQFLSRGIVLSSGAATEEYQVSASAASGTAPRFGNIDLSYAGLFKTFSGERLFTPVGTNVLDVRFVVPGTNRPATVRSFGAVFTDVDAPPGSPLRTNTYMYFYDRYGRGLAAPGNGTERGPIRVGTFNEGLTFTGGETDCEPIARVKIILGNKALGPGVLDNGTQDLVALDNLIYSEPRAIDHETLDFDADGVADVGIYRPSNGGWYILNSGSNTVTTKFFGQPGDIPVPADYDGNGRSEFAVFRPTTREWWLAPDPPFTGSRGVVFAAPGDIPITPFDYDDDGRADSIVWRPSDGGFYINSSRTPYPGGGYSIYWGQPGDIPLKRD